MKISTWFEPTSAVPPWPYMLFAFDPNRNKAHDGTKLIGITDCDGPRIRADYEQLLRVNRDINSKIRQVNDPAGKDIWEIAWEKGDCEDIALRKKYELVKLGYHRLQVNLAAVVTEWGEPHVVLRVHDEDGVGTRSWILDNLTNDVLLYQRMPHKPWMQESPLRPMSWIRIGDGDKFIKPQGS